MPRTTTVLLIGLALAVAAPAAHADDSDLDPTFGAGGTAAVPGIAEDVFAATAVQADGKIVAAGGYGQLGGSQNFLVARFRTDGTLDPSFGTGGVVQTAVGIADDGAADVAIQPDGKIVAVGTGASSPGGKDFAVLRLLPDGTRDDDFNGSGGKLVAVGPGSTSDNAEGVVIRAGGKIVIGGESGGQGATVRLNGDGSLDATYCGTGKCVLAMPGSFYVYDAAGGPGQTMLLAGRHSQGMGQLSVVLRIGPDGALDPGWSGDGMKSVNIGPADEFLFDVAVAPDGSVLAGGWVTADPTDTDRQATLLRLTAAGIADSTFGGGDGRVEYGAAGVYDETRAVRPTPDGRIVVAGTTRSLPGGDPEIMLRRFTATGAPDPSFSGDGERTLAQGDGAYAHALALVGDRIITAGSTYDGASVPDAAVHAFAHRPPPVPLAPPAGAAAPATTPATPATPIPAPATVITRAAPSGIADRTAPVLSRIRVARKSVRFVLSERARVTASAGRRTVTKTLAAGRHTLRLRRATRLVAVDAAGNRTTKRLGRAKARAAATRLKLTATADPSAPAGRTPKVIFRLAGAVKGREYKIDAIQTAGQNGRSDEGYQVGCANSVGQFSYTKAPKTSFAFKPAPLTSYELGSGSPCTGVYKGVLLTPTRSVPRKLLRFTLEVPSMRITSVRSGG